MHCGGFGQGSLLKGKQINRILRNQLPLPIRLIIMIENMFKRKK